MSDRLDVDVPRALRSTAESAAMDRALELARTGPAHGPNPRVGCVLLAPDGRVLGEGRHLGAGTPHAEAAAIADARAAVTPLDGATAVVTLEPCAHTGRTGPCTDALLAAGVRRVVVATTDPNPTAAGGVDRLRAAGVDVEVGLRRDEAETLIRVWRHAVTSGRPWVTLKTATTLDGRVAAPDGSSRWITSPQSRAHAHAVRAEVDAIVVGTGTALVDDPALTARDADGRPGPHQPLRVVVGRRELPADARVRGDDGAFRHLRTHDVAEVLDRLAAEEVRHVLVEGGPRLASAFLRAGLVDALHAYVAPLLLGGGRSAVEDLGVATLADGLGFVTERVEVLGPDVLVVAARPDLARPSSPLEVPA